ncbi:hypothetical protein SS50377_22018 [Spironucleus salmonicida]|uniref:Uncharacterized protein n=1 Tax=Spironucleus salmonicida TaxID=348837 RepID=V6LM97_9EUKA|nr:hypothetical protein SS50377_22018 [Spironucleus salmonicida]|eukprot:EST45817.1 Hypothetical protein SS50377_14392 [Spironucleus salmonicida]
MELYIPFFFDKVTNLLSTKYKLEHQQLQILDYIFSVLSNDKPLPKSAPKSKLYVEISRKISLLKDQKIEFSNQKLTIQITILSNIQTLERLGFDAIFDGEKVSETDKISWGKLLANKPDFSVKLPIICQQIAKFIIQQQQTPDFLNFHVYDKFPSNFIFDCNYQIQKQRIDKINLIPIFNSQFVIQELITRQLVRGLVRDDFLNLIRTDRLFQYEFFIGNGNATYSTQTFFAQNIEKIDINDLNIELRKGFSSQNYVFHMKISNDELLKLGFQDEIYIGLIKDKIVNIQDINGISGIFQVFCISQQLNYNLTYPFQNSIIQNQEFYSISLINPDTKAHYLNPCRTRTCIHTLPFEGKFKKCQICGSDETSFPCVLYTCLNQQYKNAISLIFDDKFQLIELKIMNLDDSLSRWDLTDDVLDDSQ